MKTLKIIAVLTLVALAAALLIASAYAYTGGRIGTSATTNSPNTANILRKLQRWNDGNGRHDGRLRILWCSWNSPTAIEHAFDNYQQHLQTNVQLDDWVLQRHDEQNSIGND